jgi:hypothetical protein
MFEPVFAFSDEMESPESSPVEPDPEDPPEEGLDFAGLSEDIEGELSEEPLSIVETLLICPDSSEENIMLDRRKTPTMAKMNRT